MVEVPVPPGLNPTLEGLLAIVKSWTVITTVALWEASPLLEPVTVAV